MGDQGKEIGRSLREAIDKKEFTPEQLTHAFGMADVSAKLLGKTAGDIHTFKFVDRLMTPAGEEVRGSRQAATENLRGLVQLSLSPESLKIGRSTSAHEAFHVLQDMFRDSDQAASNIIQRAFKGAKSFDDIDPLLLNKLKTMKDPDSGKSVYDTLKGSVTQDILDGYEQAQREREMQAYVFGSMDDAVRRGNESMSGLGSAYRRFMNYYRNFISRIGNFLRGQGYNSVDDVFKQTIAGERQAGKKIETKEDKIDYSRAAQQTGENEEEFKKWWGDSKAVDENGQPARWYSGTHSLDEKGKPFKAFGEARSGAIPGRRVRFSSAETLILHRNLQHGICQKRQP
jgi:flagellar hook-associated protein FlgK